MRRPSWCPPLTLRTLARVVGVLAPAPVAAVAEAAQALTDGARVQACLTPPPPPPMSLGPFAPRLAEPQPGDPLWLVLAFGERGQQEVAGARDNPRVLEYHATCTLHASHDEVPWCSAFVNWCFTESGYRGTDNALAASWLQWGMTAEDPRGAVVVLRRKDAPRDAATGSATGNHVGFLLAHTPTHVLVLGGNQHDAVNVAAFPRDIYRVRQVRWPRACDQRSTQAA